MRQSKHDRLTREAILAVEAGMTYGKWKAAQAKAQQSVTDDGFHKSLVKCPWCGTHFKPNRSQKYCCQDCKRQAENG